MSTSSSLSTPLFDAIPWHKTAYPLLISLSLFLFAIPISPTLQAIALASSLGLILLTRVNKPVLQYGIKQPWVWMIGAFYALVLLGCFESAASNKHILLLAGKYSKLLCLPLLVLGFADKRTRVYGIHAFLAAMIVTTLVAHASALHWITLSNNAPGAAFHNYIMTGHMISLACYITAWLAIKCPRWRFAYGSLFVLFSEEILFLSQGRTGYIIYFVLMGLLLLQVLNKKHLLMGVAGLFLVAGLAITESPRIQAGFQAIGDNLVHYQQGDKNTSVGFRLQFQAFSYTLLKEAPWFGQGTGGFIHAFETRQPIPAWGHELLEPHNQYSLIAVEYGLFGLLVYSALLLTLMRACWQLPTLKPYALGLWVPFLLGCFSDSLLLYSTSGYFFLGLIALCLGEAVNPQHKIKDCR